MPSLPISNTNYNSQKHNFYSIFYMPLRTSNAGNWPRRHTGLQALLIQALTHKSFWGLSLHVSFMSLDNLYILKQSSPFINQTLVPETSFNWISFISQ